MTNFDYYFRGVANCLALLLWINISYPAGRPFGCGRCKSERTLISQLGASLSCLSIWIGFECGRKSHDESPVIEYDECSGGSKGSRSSSQWSLSESEVNWQLCGANGLSLERSDDSQRKSTSLISAYQFRRGALLGVASRPTPYVCLINVDCKQRSTSKVSSTRGAGKVAAVCYLHLAYNSWILGSGWRWWWWWCWPTIYTDIPLIARASNILASCSPLLHKYLLSNTIHNAQTKHIRLLKVYLRTSHLHTHTHT